MAKYVIAGKSDCPFYAKAELLADELQSRLKDFKVHKIVIQPEEWQGWVSQTCKEKNWTYGGKSPMIWKELLDRGGKGLLLGSCSDFLEMANGYYGITSEKFTEELKNIAQENKITKDKDDEIEAARRRNSKPLKVCITAGASNVSYHIASELCDNKIFAEEEVVISLLDQEENIDILEGICMELVDCAPAQLKRAEFTVNARDAFEGASLVILLDGFNMVRNTDEATPYKEMLKSLDFTNIKKYGELIDQFSNDNVKVLVAGGPSNLICNLLIAVSKRKNIENFMALSRNSENRCKSLIAGRLNVKTNDIQSLLIWGQPDYNQIHDVTFSRVLGYDGAIWGPHIKGFSQDTKEMVHDEKWLSQQFQEELAKKNAQLKSLEWDEMSMSFGSAIIDQLMELYNCSENKQMHSLGIASKGWYDIPTGVVCSFPVKFTKAGYEVIESLAFEEEKLARLKELGNEIKSDCENLLSSYDLTIEK